MEEKRFFYVALLVTPFGTGTLIRTVTGFPYNHMGISFSPEMKNFYSFARYYKKQPFYAGFVKESVLRYNNNGKIAKIKVCAVPVTEENYQKAKEHSYIQGLCRQEVRVLSTTTSFTLKTESTISNMTEKR